MDLSGLDRLEPFKRRLAFAGRLRRALGPQSAMTGEPIVVGGAALEFYSTGGYATQDLDLVLFDATPAFALLQEIGFVRRDRYAFHPELDLMVEFPGKVLTHGPQAYDRVAEVLVAGERALVIGIEDLLIGRLHGAVTEGRANEAKWVREMILLHHRTIDWEALESLARGEGARTVQYLTSLRQELAP